MNPMTNKVEAAKNFLKTTNDIQGFLSNFRMKFLQAEN